MERPRWHKDDEADRLLEALSQYAKNAFRDGHFVERLLTADPGSTHDRAEVVAALMRTLLSLCQTADGAAHWLFRLKWFCGVRCDDFGYNFSEEDFAVLESALDWVETLARFKDRPDAFYKDLFGYIPQPPKPAASGKRGLAALLSE